MQAQAAISTYEQLLTGVLNLVSDIGEGQCVTATTPLMYVGVDSLAAGQFVETLVALTGLAVEPTVIFEYPTVEAVTLHLAGRLGLCVTTTWQPDSNGQGQPLSSSRLSVGVITQQWPGGGGGLAAALRALLGSAGDALGSPPSQRWILDNEVDVRTLSARQLQCIQHGGYIDAECFDSAAFHLSHAEVSRMDPQQRLLLEVGTQSLHANGMRRHKLLGSSVGHFLGMSKADWSRYQYARRGGYANYSVYATTCDSNTVAAGRLSFVLGMHGPCMTLDTACSSALVALQSASLNTQSRECDVAVVTAVRLELTLQHTLDAAFASMLSLNGRCFTLDRRADGYVSSEGVCAAVACATSLFQQGSLWAAHFERGVVRCDGRSASLTAPNGTAQAVMFRAANAARHLTNIELHGTGTALGDPTELSALATVQARTDGCIRNPSAIGGAKASFGHTMAASGLLGVCKILQQVMGAGSLPNAQLRALNKLVTSSVRRLRAPPLLFTQSAHHPQSRSGVSSFGYSGTIAHVVLSVLSLCGLSSDGPPATLPPITGKICGQPSQVYRRVRSPWVKRISPRAAPAPSTASALTALPDTPPSLALFSVCWVGVEETSAATQSAIGTRSWVVCTMGAIPPLITSRGCTVAAEFMQPFVASALGDAITVMHDVAVILPPDDRTSPSHSSTHLVVQLVRSQ